MTAATAGTSVSPDARGLWRASRGILAAAVVLLLAGAVIALLSAGEDGALHPRSAAPHGSRAVAELLADQGVRVTEATTAAEAADATGPGTTLLIVHPERLPERQLDRLATATARSGGRTVLVAPDQTVLDAFAPGVTASGPYEAAELAPACTTARGAEAPGRLAGSARLGGYGFLLPAAEPPPDFACYPVDDAPSPPALVSLATAAGGDTVLLGSPDILYNERLDELGNASLALQLLGTREHLTWFLPPAAGEPAGEQESFFGLIDPGWRWAALQLAIALGLTVVWRARRLGPVVTERLPVTVRAAETTEGHARLYHQSGARDRAAEALRAACRVRLARATGLPPAAAHADGALPAAVAARSGGVSAVAVRDLLFGPAPPDDDALVRLADDLDALERGLGAHGASPAPGLRDPEPTTDKDR